MSEQWYKIIKDEEYCSDILEIFCGLHDYKITKIDIEYQSSTVTVYLRYDTDEEGAALRFIGVSRLNICPLKEDESPWIFGSIIMLTGHGDLLWHDHDEKYSEEEVFERHDMNWIEAKEIHFAWLDQDDNVVPLTEEKLNPIWKIMNWDTGKYEDVEKHFEVFEVRI